jgi:hypothetical protein
MDNQLERALDCAHVGLDVRRDALETQEGDLQMIPAGWQARHLERAGRVGPGDVISAARFARHCARYCNCGAWYRHTLAGPQRSGNLHEVVRNLGGRVLSRLLTLRAGAQYKKGGEDDQGPG